MLAKLQEKWRKAHEKERDLARKLEYTYGKTWMAPQGKRAKYDAVNKRLDAAMEAIFAWLDANSPRNWRTGVPAFWVCEHLTEADALTADRLSVVPPVAYGSLPGDSIRFAQAVSTERILS